MFTIKFVSVGTDFQSFLAKRKHGLKLLNKSCSMSLSLCKNGKKSQKALDEKNKRRKNFA